MLTTLGVRVRPWKASGFGITHLIGAFAALATVLTLPGLALAADITVEPPQKIGDPAFINLDGEIKSGDDEKFRKIAAEYSDAAVFLNSTGGLIAPAMDIGRTIKLRGYRTAIYKTSSCASACALIWVAGSKRIIFEGGEVGFHAAYLDKDGTKLEAGVGNALVGLYLSQLGFGESTVVFATSAPPEKILWLTKESASMSGIDFDTITGDKNPQAPKVATPTSPPFPASTTRTVSDGVDVPLVSGPLTLKLRVAVGRFTNATQYGRALLLPGEKDPLADQAADMLTARLVDTGKFIVLERRDMDAIKNEQGLIGANRTADSDTLLVGSVTQFGRKAEGKVGFLNSKASQIATATVEIRLVDVRTGQAFFSTIGSGSATVEVSEVAGFGSRAAYDSSLNDKAISAAISDLMTNLMQRLQQRTWSTDVLSIQGGQVLISGGANQGLHIGDRLSVARRGKLVVSQQTGLPIELPSETIATIQLTGFFGAGDAEGSQANIIAGAIDPKDIDLVVTGQRK